MRVSVYIAVMIKDKTVVDLKTVWEVSAIWVSWLVVFSLCPFFIFDKRRWRKKCNHDRKCPMFGGGPGIGTNAWEEEVRPCMRAHHLSGVHQAF